ncbi:DUF3014 domain-containing protein [Gallaecimonas kandeliae]|uniref:DUF3014 domain-containing protein n=1 Tax=Gallaecimonas kandeliae TaxID=3029055 RepID=UPI0026487B51|nr:DUF3014 domain-containing protein [Gallaecimonas kandeliae]WKE65413.1 DUF3014 domain-containing protein [Gallaecimonas kandeliae]
MQADPQTRPPKDGASSKPFLILAAVLILGALAWYFWPKAPAPKQEEAPLPPPVVEQKTQPQPQPKVEPQPAAEEVQPEPAQTQPQAPAAPPLPALKDSDPEVRAALGEMLPAKSPVDIQQAGLIDKFTQILTTAVEGYLPERQRVIASPDQPFAVVRDGETLYLDSDSYHRFDPYVQAFVGMDDTKLLAFIDRFAPLFKEAFATLGLGDDSIQGSLNQIIDLALDTPDPADPIKLKQPKVLYQFADPALENLKPIQKILIRMGPDNRAKVKAKLERLKDALGDSVGDQ